MNGAPDSSEDQLAIIDAKTTSDQDHSDAMISLMMQITQTLTEIENPEALESSPIEEQIIQGNILYLLL